jgi:hypothetical protein
VLQRHETMAKATPQRSEPAGSCVIHEDDHGRPTVRFPWQDHTLSPRSMEVAVRAGHARHAHRCCGRLSARLVGGRQHGAQE